jgi:Flp pilus assembly protein TadG
VIKFFRYPASAITGIGVRMHACGKLVSFRAAFGRGIFVCLDDRASQIVEFAVSLPLLVLFVIGIFDFSSAITLKQKLTNAAREGARVAASDPASDLGSPSGAFPASVADAFYVVDRYLLSEKINDCGLFSSGPASTGILKWTATAATSGCTGAGLILTIQRGNISPSTSGPNIDVISTVITIQYPYTWQFTNVSGFFGGISLPTTITTTATAFNEN